MVLTDSEDSLKWVRRLLRLLGSNDFAKKMTHDHVSFQNHNFQHPKNENHEFSQAGLINVGPTSLLLVDRSIAIRSRKFHLRPTVISLDMSLLVDSRILRKFGSR
jgi:hypothetical protein